MTHKANSEFVYDVVVSFAGEDRAIVEKFVRLLDAKKVAYFYDEDKAHDLWGRDLTTDLADVYEKQARYCLMFISEHYLRKKWTNFERLHIQARAFRDRNEYILPIRLDDTEIPGIPETIGFRDLRQHDIENIVNTLGRKLAKAKGQSGPHQSHDLDAIGQKPQANKSDSQNEANQIGENIILKYYDMPSISRVPPLRVEVENNNLQSIICKAFIKEAISFSPDDNIKKYLGSNELFWKGDSKSIVKEKKIEAGAVGTVYLADINKENEYLFFVVQEDINAYVKPFRKLGEYRITGEIQATTNKRQFIKEFNLIFEVVISPKTHKRFIRTVQANILRGD